ncbi:hypothetical protein ACFL6B_00690 [Thermodesulfobacteriota bacterium]
MKKVMWDLIDINILKSWAGELNIEKDIEGFYKHEIIMAKIDKDRTVPSEHEFYATYILNQLFCYISNDNLGISRVQDDPDAQTMWPNQLKNFSPDLAEFWDRAKEYWGELVEIGGGKIAEQSMERSIVSLNGYFKLKFGTESDLK